MLRRHHSPRSRVEFRPVISFSSRTTLRNPSICSPSASAAARSVRPCASARPAGDRGLHSHRGPGLKGAPGFDHAADFVARDHARETTELATVEVEAGAADADGGGPDEHLPRAVRGHGEVNDVERVRGVPGCHADRACCRADRAYRNRRSLHAGRGMSRTPVRSVRGPPKEPQARPAPRTTGRTAVASPAAGKGGRLSETGPVLAAGDGGLAGAIRATRGTGEGLRRLPRIRGRPRRRTGHLPAPRERRAQPLDRHASVRFLRSRAGDEPAVGGGSRGSGGRRRMQR